MAVQIASIDGHDVAYEIFGEGNTGGTWISTLGGRFAMDDPGFSLLAEELAKHNKQVILWDRPNCGSSEVRFDGPSESVIQADALAGLVKHLGVGPVMMQGGSGGARVTLLAAQRHPEICKGIALNWITGSTYGLLILAMVYCFDSYFAAFTGGMEAVVELDLWKQVQERNPKNRDIILSQDREEFMDTMQRWMRVYYEVPGELIPGASDEELRAFTKPAIIFNSGHSDPHHPRYVTEGVAALLPNASLLDPPWGDHEWLDRGADNSANANGLFRRWHLLTPQLLEFEASIS
jgi:pimeloyl-ACP methyl ester carboxylesterase